MQIIDIAEVYLPYIALFGGIIVLLFIIIVPIIDFVLKRRNRQTKKNETPQIIAMRIRELSKQLEEILASKKR